MRYGVIEELIGRHHDTSVVQEVVPCLSVGPFVDDGAREQLDLDGGHLLNQDGVLLLA